MWFKSHWTLTFLSSVSACNPFISKKIEVERDSSFLNALSRTFFFITHFESFSEHYFSLTDWGNPGWLSKCNNLEPFCTGRAFQILISRSLNAVLLKNTVYRCHPYLKKKASLKDSLKKLFRSCCKTDSYFYCSRSRTDLTRFEISQHTNAGLFQMMKMQWLVIVTEWHLSASFNHEHLRHKAQ